MVLQMRFQVNERSVNTNPVFTPIDEDARLHFDVPHTNMHISRTIRHQKSSYYPGTLYPWPRILAAILIIIFGLQDLRLLVHIRIIMAAVAAGIVFAAALGPCTAATKGYLDHVADALTALEDGRSVDSLASLKQASTCNSNDPLAQVALGLTLLYGGRPADALTEFARAGKSGAAAEADYGRGLVALSKGDIGQAVTLFCQAQAAAPEAAISASIEYAKSLAGGAYPQISEHGDNEALKAIAAVGLMRNGKFDEATALWKDLQSSAWRPGYGERLGCSMTFDKKAPVVFTGWPINGAYKSPAVDTANLPAVSGNVTLKADLSKAGKIDMVSFYVDGNFVGMTNHSPFSYSWDTTKIPNGAHTVTIQGFYDGLPTSEKTMRVLVRNEGSNTPASRVGGEQADKLWKRLWAAMLLKPSSAAINYNLALCAFEKGSQTEAAAALERVLAANPDYMDAADRLAGIYATRGSYARLTKLNTNRKVVALTFDDGPKESTDKLLDILSDKGVKATFFVVGKQAEAYPNQLKRIAIEGHDIQNHTYNHRALEFLSEREIQQELFRTSAAVRSAVGAGTRYLRPPGGREGKKLPEVMKKFNLGSVFWTINCGDAEGTTRQKMLNHIFASVQPGAILLMHNAELVTLNALPEIIDKLRAQGYEFVTISDIAGEGV